MLGRWEDPHALTYRIELADGPLEPAAFERAIQRALDAWSASGAIGFRAAASGDEPSVVFAWRRGAHGACQPFGADPSLAHSGPVGPGAFVHFDAARSWSEDGSSDAESLFAAALHETGHVVGLGHSLDPAAAMYADSRAERLGASDLAGIASLYGGLEDSADDLEILDLDPAGRPHARAGPALRRVAPHGRSELALFDTDGDGDLEVLVWRTDPEGHGALAVYHFARGPRLERTEGPFMEAVLTGARAELRTARDGERLLVAWVGGRVAEARTFDRSAPLHERPLPLPADLSPAAAPPWIGDLDGDGTSEAVQRVAAR